MKHIKLTIWILNTVFILLIIAGVIGLACKKHWSWEEWVLICSIVALVLFNIVNVLTWMFGYVKKSKETIKEYTKKKDIGDNKEQVKQEPIEAKIMEVKPNHANN